MLPRFFAGVLLALIPASGNTLSKLPLYFEQNRGQTNHRVDFLSRGPGYALFLSAGNAVLKLQDSSVHMTLQGALHARAEGLEPLPGRSNYLRGGDGSADITDIRQFERVRYRSVYPGVDVVYYGKDHKLEYDFVVSPGADPGQIRLRFKGAERLQVDEAGKLVLAPGLSFHKPVLYQEENGERISVGGGFQVRGRDVTFQVGDYRRDLPLVIDPVLSYSTYLGGKSNEFSGGMAVDGAGNVYVAGITISEDYPVTSGAYRTSQENEGSPVFVSKLNSTGTALLYSTFISDAGCHNPGVPIDLAVDPSGQAILAASLCPNILPTPNAYSPGNYGTAVLKLNAAGSALVYLGYPGVNNSWGGRSYIASGQDGSAYIVAPASSNFSTTPGAFQRTFAGVSDIGIVHLNSAGTAALYSTFIGGASTEWPAGIAVDAGGTAYITGMSLSANFPVTAGGVSQPAPDTATGFAVALNPQGSALTWSTMLPETSPTSISVSLSGEAFIAGYASTGFQSTPGAYLTSGSGHDWFLVKIPATGQTPEYATRIGPGLTGDLFVAVTPTGEAWVVGAAGPIMPTTSNAFQQPNSSGSSDIYFAKFNSSGSVLRFGSYFGGTGFESVTKIGLDNSGNLYASGQTTSKDLPTTSTAYKRAIGGDSDSYILKIDNANTSCSYTLGSGFQSFTAAAGSGSVAVTANPGCSWIATPPYWWITFRNAAGVGSDSVTFDVAANDSVNGRSVTLTIAGQTYTVSQAGAACSYSVSPQSLTFDSEGGIGNVSVTAPQGCAWSATSNAAWVVVNQGQIGSGNGVVRYTVSPAQTSRVGTITIAGQTFTVSQGITAAQPVSVTPNTGTGTSQTFTVRYTQDAGSAGIATAYLMISNVISGANSCFVEYNAVANAFRLRNDADTAWSANIPAGSGVVTNSSCTLNGGGGAASLSGNTLTVTFPITFNQGAGTTRNIYALAIDNTNLNSGWKTLGTWTIGSATPQAPDVVSLAPAAGSGASGTFTAVFRHPGGQAMHYLGYILFLPIPNVVSFNAQGTCLIEFNSLGGIFNGKGGMRLINNAGTDWLGRVEGEPLGPTTPALSNNACTVNVAGASAAFSGTDMTVTVPVTFKGAGVTPVMGTFIQSEDRNGQWSDFRQFGNWSMPGAGTKAGPFVNGVNPASGTGSGTLSVSAGHTGGIAQISMIHLRLNTAIVGGNPCHAIYFPADNSIALVNDTGDALVQAPLGTPVTTSRCSIGAGASKTISGNTILLNLPMTFNTAAFGAGTKNMYVNVFDVTGAVSHWVMSGTRTIQ